MIENIFKIIKADRYTKDGCDEIQKAKDNLAEDEKYNIGDISKKTGLMKTANGWVEPPKGGRTPKSNVPGNKPLNNKYYKDDVRTEAGEKKILSETKTDVIESKVKDLEDLKKRNGGKLGTQGEKSLQLAKEELAKRNGSAPKKETPQERSVRQQKAVSEAAKQKSNVVESLRSKGLSDDQIINHPDYIHADEMLNKTMDNPDYPFKPKTDSERAERAKFEKDRDDFIERMDKIRRENKSVKFDEYGLPSNETIELKENFLKKEGVADPNKLTNKEFNNLAQKLDKELGINNFELSQELLVTPAEEKTKAKFEKIDWTKSNPKTKKEDLSRASVLEGKLAKSGLSDEEKKEYMELKERIEIPVAKKDLKKYDSTPSYDDFNPLRDSAPRVLTGDCKIRIRK